MIASQLSGHCEVISNRLWRHQQNVNRASETRRRRVKIVVLSLFMDSSCRLRNKIIYALSWRTVYALTRVLFFGVYFHRCCTTRTINANITLSRAHKQFTTRVHVIFSMYSTRKGSNFEENVPVCFGEILCLFDMFFGNLAYFSLFGGDFSRTHQGFRAQ